MTEDVVPGGNMAEAPEKRSDFAKKLLSLPPVPGAVRSALGHQFSNKLMAIMISEELNEVDILCESGELTPEQVQQYMLVSENYNLCLDELVDLATEYARQVKPKIIEFARNNARGEHKAGLLSPLHNLNLLIEARFTGFKDKKLYSRAAVDEFRKAVYALIGSDMIDIYQDSRTPREVKAILSTALDRLNGIALQSNGSPFEGINLFNEKKVIRETMSLPGTRQQLAEQLSKLEKNEDGSVAVQDQESDDLNYIKNESLYKLIPRTIIHDRGPQITVMRDLEKDLSQGAAIYIHVLVNFDQEPDGSFYDTVTAPNGGPGLKIVIKEGRLNCILDSVTGQLKLNSCNVNLDQFIDKQSYHILRQLILKGLRSYLESKEPDIEDLFKVSGPLENVDYTIPTNTNSNTVTEVNNGGKSDKVKDVVPNTEEVDRPEPEVHLPTNEQGNVIPKHQRAEMMQRISGARGNEVLNAFRDLAGREIRVNGSHFIFRNSDTGVTYPIPKHSKGKIPLGIILDGIKALGYSVPEFAEKLGYEMRG